MMTSRRMPAGESGFSLLEVVVAVAILGFSLGALYQAAGGATRIVRIDERRSYAVELARSLIAAHAVVPRAGTSETGETQGGFVWRVVTEPEVFAESVALEQGALQRLNVVVSWDDGPRTREISLDSVVAGRDQAE